MENGIAAFYDNKNVFITGGSGFLGKVVVEKLLRCCPGIKKIFMLLRSKRGRSADDRIKSLFNIELFKALRNKYPSFEEKVQAIAGDIMQEGLGISCEDRKYLQENVDIVIHSAATVKFDEKLRIALQMNVIGVKEIVSFCKGIKNLQILCHISTAYSNCDKDAIEEKIYPTIAEPDKVIDAAKWMTDEMLAALTPSLLGNYPNTYTFTKGLAEQVILTEAEGIPSIILRPSIICSAYDEPYPGWIDNYNGLIGLMAATGKGMLRTMLYASGEAVADVVPVDYVANSIIAATYYGAFNPSKDITVFNCTSGNVNPLTWGFLETYTLGIFKKYPFDEIFRRPNFSFESNKISYYYWTYVCHRIPAVVADMLAILIGAKPRVCKLYEKIEKAVDTVKFFTTREWVWTPDNLLQLQAAVPENEKELFQFDMTTIDWRKYIARIVLGVKQYLFKDNMEDIDKARWQIPFGSVGFLYCILCTSMASSNESLTKVPPALVQCCICCLSSFAVLQSSKHFMNTFSSC
eukprot:gene18243-20063_t